MKCNYKEKHKSEFEKLPRIEREEISKFVFKSALKTAIAIILFRCEKFRHWKKDDLKRLWDDIIALFQMNIFNRSISDMDLIKRYENMLDIDFDILDDIVEVKI